VNIYLALNANIKQCSVYMGELYDNYVYAVWLWQKQWRYTYSIL